MKTVMNVGAQGDILFVRLEDVGLEAIPSTALEVQPEGGRHVVAHSETGHHHVVDATGIQMFVDPGDPFTCYLRMNEVDHLEVLHLRDYDTHEPQRIAAGESRVVVGRRQREYVPGGMRMVQD